LRLTLRHLEVGNRPGQRVGDDNISNLSEDEIGTMAVNIYALAESDAIGLGSAEQKYVLLCFDEESPVTDPRGRCIFEVHTGMQQKILDDAQPRYLDSHPPTEQGLISQVMKQNSEMHEHQMSVFQTFGTMVTLLGKQLERSQTRVVEQETKAFENFDALERARGEQWLRDKQMKLLEVESESKKEMWGLAKMALPAILRRIGAADPNAKIVTDNLHEINTAMAFAANEETFHKALEALPDEKTRVQFAEWVAFNIQQYERLEQQRTGQAAPGNGTQRQLTAPQAQPQAPQVPPTPPTREQLEASRLAAIEQAKKEAAGWAQRLKALEAADNAAAAAKQAEADAAKPAAQPKKPKVAKKDAVQPQSETPAATAPTTETQGE
jgi:hypothetical protein